VSCDAAASNQFGGISYTYPSIQRVARRLGALRSPAVWTHAGANTGFGNFVVDTVRGWAQADGALTLGLSIQTFPNAGNPSADERLRAGIEMLTWGHPGRFQVDANGVRQGVKGQWLFAIGLDAIGDPGGQPAWTAFQGAGPSARMSFAFPAIDVQLAAYTGTRLYAHVRGDPLDSFGSHGALRLSTGFGFLQMGIESGWDSFLDVESRRLHRTRVLTTMLNLTTGMAVRH
jgi:hypothetical protein